ncbi:alkylation response protein AidB-like acyl-CoA dehydrogenase [Streptomyces sp. DSM 42143]|uniref:acyl-CoA dehydrogenase family protein n=1 Tax=Streptomyces sp. DSM 42143 TaxID=2817711 RepID=UPI0027825060|nr:acyl-CoA dehydrogenase family protein [Streptomyces sp. DSM 42143]MDQ0390112.1 alkylation response protein AidB-like acyl-CoA dehydrogenase [Streptomyces sp. DSM 42143]
MTAARGTAAEAVPTQAPHVTGGEPEQAAFLEAALGDPFDPGNPHGQLALLRADDARAVPEATEALLAEASLGAEFVPHDLGGRLTDLERLARVLRPVFRRDLALGYGFGITSLFAASSVWTAGDDDQRRAVARVLLGGGRVSIVHRQIAHANAILRNELAATRTPDGGFVLNGRKDAVINADRTDVFVTYARTDAQDGPGSHSVLLLGPEPPVSGRVRRSRRVETSGMRGARFCGIELTDVALPASAVVGSVGEGVSLALRSFQISHCLVPGTVVACVDGVLRQAVRAATENRPGGQPARRRHKAITGVFADLLACDAMAVTGLRALSLAPRDAYVPAAAVKYTMPDLLREDLDEMAAVLGARGYDRGPHYGGFQKLARDLPVAGLGHSGTALCQAVIVPQLSTLARTVWFRSAEPPAELFDPGAPLPVFDHRRLAHSGTDDLLSATLVAVAGRLDGTGGRDPLRTALARLARTFVDELRVLRARCAALPGADGTAFDPQACVLADRYALVLAAAACLGVWEGRAAAGDGFLAGPAWAVVALGRLARRLGAQVPDVPAEAESSVLAEVLERCRTGLSLDLYATRLAG